MKKVAVLLMNLGGPETQADVKGFLYNLFADRRIIGLPFGLGYAPKGSRSMALGPGPVPPAGGGDWTLGINGSYLDAWRFSLAYTNYFGHEDTFLDSSFRPTYAQALKDRNFVALSVRRTF